MRTSTASRCTVRCELLLAIASGLSICVGMRGDRRSAYEQWNLSLGDALKNEFAIGNKSRESGVLAEGAKRFAQGAGRHGSFEGFE